MVPKGPTNQGTRSPIVIELLWTAKKPQDARLQERAKTLVSQLIGATEQRNDEVEEELSLALSAEETLEEDDDVQNVYSNVNLGGI